MNHAIEQGGTFDTTLLKDNAPSLRDDLGDEGGRGRPGEVPQVRLALRLGDLHDALHGCHTGEDGRENWMLPAAFPNFYFLLVFPGESKHAFPTLTGGQCQCVP